MRNRATNLLAWSFLRRTDPTPTPWPALRAKLNISISAFGRCALLSGLLLLVALSSLATTPAAADAFDAANRLYEQGNYKEAAAAYEQMLNAGQTSPAVYFNLGNALFKSGRIGRAIATYRHTEQLTPRDPDLRANLRFARNQVQGPTLRAPLWERLLTQLSLNEWTRLSAVSIWLTFGLLTIRQLRPSWKRSLRNWTLLAGLATLLLLACLTFAWFGQARVQTAIIVTSETSLRASPFEESQSVFTANDGAELRVLDQKDEWLQLTDGDRRIGWVKRDAVIVWPRAS